MSTAASGGSSEPIAVVGIGCRLPGGVVGLESLGALLADGRDVIGDVPADRWAPEFWDPQRQRPGSTSSHVGAFLDDVDRFDAAYFGIAPREAAALDPQQRILLEVGWEAMADSGRPRDAWQGTRTAVFIGMLAGDYLLLHTKTLGAAGIGPHYASGNEFSFGAGRLAYTFDLRGPAATLHAACSSSLLAVHLAGQSLRAGECDFALAGGVSLLLTPELSIFMSRIGAISATGRCRPFDVAADGVVRGEGCGVVVLRRLSDALADGDRVYAVIRGSAVNHDGSTPGLTVPSATAQMEVLRTALANAGIAADEVSYVEAHGTGTALGDRLELSALAEVFGPGRAAGRPLLIGSHKAVFGHTDAAAGITGLLKAIWIVRSATVPGQPHLEQLSPAVDWDRVRIAVPTSARAITSPAGQPVRAGVSAFGLSGTNAHVLVESCAPDDTGRPAAPPRPYILLTSAPSRPGLADQAERLRALLAEMPDLTEDGLADLVASAASRRTHEAHRFAVVGTTREELTAALAGCRAGYQGVSAGDEEPRTVFVYSGQGSQWPGMAADLYDSVPVVRDAIDECDALARQHVPWSLVEELRRTEDSRLGSTDVVQPAIFAVQVALTRWWAECGVTPAVLLGHSVGEITAAHVAGCLTLADAMRLVVQRGLILHETAGRGRMAAVTAAEHQVRDYLAGSATPVSVAAVNGPESVVLAGPPAELDEICRLLSGRGLRCAPLPVDYAFHSSVVADCGPRLLAAAAGLTPAPPSVRLLSTVDPLADQDHGPGAAYWADNLTQPVLLWPAADRLLSEGNAVFVEIGPHPVLAGALTGAVRRRGRQGPVTGTLRRGVPGTTALHHALAQLHVVGVPVDWRRCTGLPGRYRDLPVPSWGGGRYWLPGVERGRQDGALTTAAPVKVRLSLLDSAGQVLQEMVARPAPGSDVRPGRPAALPPESAAQPSVGVPAPTAEAVTGARDTASRIAAMAGEVLGIGPAAALPRRRGLFELGLDSMGALELRTRMETEYGVELPATIVFEHPTIEQLTQYLTTCLTDSPGAWGNGTRLPAASAGPGRPGPAGAPGPDHDRAVAVIGLACRLPGAASAEEFWSLLVEGRAAIADLPADRRAGPSWSPAGPGIPTRGGFLADVAGFDAAFFRISPREARSMDPQQRLLLELAWEALEDAGLPAWSLHGAQAGVYIGLNTADYQHTLARDLENVDLYYGTGTSFAAAAGRISYVLGLLGPSMAVDTACSGSLTAIHLACQGLRDGDCEVALVGGANVIASPTVSASMAAAGALAPDGRCKSFDDRADGYGRGEGAVVLVLKTMETARRDGDRVYAVLRGSAVNQDGASGGLTVPSRSAQVAVLRKALERAGWGPGDVDYVEAHGTGTPLGDPIEIRALAEAFGADRATANRLIVGSVKANIGHLEAAAGIAGLLKVILALYRGTIPAHLVNEPSSRIDWAALPVGLAAGGASWPRRDRPRRAGVSAFGFSGSNAHVLAEQAPAPPGNPHRPPRSAPPYVLPVTAASPEALRPVSALLAGRIRVAPDELDDIAHTAMYRRSLMAHRAVAVGGDATSLARALDAVARGEQTPWARVGCCVPDEPVTVAFWYGADLPSADRLAQLVTAPVYADALARCSDQLAEVTGNRCELLGVPAPGLLGAYVFAHQVAATALWAALGLRPQGAGGTGAGRTSAAWAAGALTQADALRALAGHADAIERGQPLIPILPGGSRLEPGPLKEHGFDLLVDVTPPGPGACVLDEAALTVAEAVAAGYQPVTPAARAPVSLPAYPWERLRFWHTGPRTPAIAEPAADDQLFTLEWCLIDPPDEGSPAGPWAVLGVGAEADEVAAALKAQGHVVVIAEPAEAGDRVASWQRALDGVSAAHPDCRGVVFAPPAHVSQGASPGQGVAEALDALALGQAMAALPRGPGRLWFVTKDAHGPPGTGGRTDPAHCAVWEVGRVLAMELPGRWGGLVDIGAEPVAVTRALCSAVPGDQLCVRGGRWYSARLGHAPRSPSARSGIDAGRCHVVAGGAAAWPAVTALADCGARRILWVGDDPVPGRLTGVEVERCGYVELSAWLAGEGQVGEVVLVAVPPPTSALKDTSVQVAALALAQVTQLAAVCATAARHQAQGFLLVMSAATAWGSVNTAGAAAAAGWLAGYGATVTAAPTRLVRLMPCADTGELAPQHRGLFEESGLRLLAAGEAAAALHRSLLAGPADLHAAAVDLNRYVRLCQDLAPRPFLDAIEVTAPAVGQLGLELLRLPEARRGERLLDHVTAVVAEALGLPADELDPESGFFDLGLDSVMALRVRARLEDDLGAELPSTLAFECPTAARLAGHLAGLLASAPPPTRPSRPQPPVQGAPAAVPPVSRAQVKGELSAPTAAAVGGGDDLLRELHAAMAAAELELGAGTQREAAS